MKFPDKIEERRQKDFIHVDKKYVGIWDIIKLGNQGGVINLEGNFAIEVVKSDQKWCTLYVIQYANGAAKQTQTFTPIKKIKDDALVNELKSKLKNLEKFLAEEQRLRKQLEVSLAEYKQTTLSSVSDEVQEI